MERRTRGEIVSYRPVEHRRLLGEERDPGAKPARRDLARIAAVEHHGARIRLE